MDGYAGVMIGIRCDRSDGYSCPQNTWGVCVCVYAPVSATVLYSLGERSPHLGVPHGDLERSLLDRLEQDGRRPLPLVHDDEKAVWVRVCVCACEGAGAGTGGLGCEVSERRAAGGAKGGGGRTGR